MPRFGVTLVEHFSTYHRNIRLLVAEFARQVAAMSARTGRDMAVCANGSLDPAMARSGPSGLSNEAAFR